MTSWVVADSGIYIASIIPEAVTDEAQRLIARWKQSGIQIAAPALFRYEVIAVMRKSVVRGRLTSPQAASRIAMMQDEPIEYFIDDALLKRAFELAERFNQPTAYDSQYLAVAERLNAAFWTTDERFYNAVRSDLGWVRWLQPDSSL